MFVVALQASSAVWHTLQRETLPQNLDSLCFLAPRKIFIPALALSQRWKNVKRENRFPYIIVTQTLERKAR